MEACHLPLEKLIRALHHPDTCRQGTVRLEGSRMKTWVLLSSCFRTWLQPEGLLRENGALAEIPFRSPSRGVFSHFKRRNTSSWVLSIINGRSLTASSPSPREADTATILNLKTGPERAGDARGSGRAAVRAGAAGAQGGVCGVRGSTASERGGLPRAGCSRPASCLTRGCARGGPADAGPACFYCRRVRRTHWLNLRLPDVGRMALWSRPWRPDLGTRAHGLTGEPRGGGYFCTFRSGTSHGACVLSRTRQTPV